MGAWVYKHTPYKISPPSGVHFSPAAQSSAAAVHPPFFISHRQTALQVCSQISPGAHWVVDVQLVPAVPTRVDSGQAQATWSMLDGSKQARPAGHPARPAAAAAPVGSQLALQVW